MKGITIIVALLVLVALQALGLIDDSDADDFAERIEG